MQNGLDGCNNIRKSVSMGDLVGWNDCVFVFVLCVTNPSKMHSSRTNNMLLSKDCDGRTRKSRHTANGKDFPDQGGENPRWWCKACKPHADSVLVLVRAPVIPNQLPRRAVTPWLPLSSQLLGWS